MSSYGRNFDFRIPPRSENRAGRYQVPLTAYSGSGAGGASAVGTPQGAGLIPIGAPVVVDSTVAVNSLLLQTVKLATGAQAPVGGVSGIAVFEVAPWPMFQGLDPFLSTYSDLGVIPLGRAIQLVSGPYVKVVFTNTPNGIFLGQRTYTGRNMVQDIGATPNVSVGQYLTPGTGDDVDGYWTTTASLANAWMVVTGVDESRQEVEARMLF